MKTLITYLIGLGFLMTSSYSQTKIAELTFEGLATDLIYTTSISYTNGGSNYFIRTDGSNISGLVSFNNQQGDYYFGAQNIDDEPDVSGSIPAFLDIDNINISGYTNLEFRVHLAEDDTGANEHWDNTITPFNDYVHFNYDIDNTGTFSNLIWIEANGGFLSTDQFPRIDTDYDGFGDGTEITETFTEFTQTIVGTGLLLDIQIEFSFNAQYEDIAIDNIEIWGTSLAEEVDWCNIQTPNTSPQNMDVGDNFDVYAQVYEPGLTESAGQGIGIEAWIGYNTVNNDPQANDATWTWIPASYNEDSENNDEYMAEIGSGLPVGTYYYAGRLRLNGGPFVYGGTTGIWNNDSVELVVNPDEVDWCNLQYPPSTTIDFGDSFLVYGRVYEPGITDTPASQGLGVSAWIGLSMVDAGSTNDFTSTNWTWIPANYNTLCPDCNDPTNTVENNDEYFLDIGPYIPGSGTYYYVVRFQLNDGPYSYGGYSVPISPNPSGGGFWDGTANISQELTVNSNCDSTVTWNGTWSAAPDLTTEVVLTTDYDMNGPETSFSACNLVINAGVRLTIADSDYIEVNNNIVNNGEIVVDANGSVVQHNDNATVTGNNATVIKRTSPLNNWYEYTYWCSPVSNETIENGLFDSDPNRRYWFNAANFVDAQAEINNTNTYAAGQDDIDDDGNDWQFATATSIMTPGVGYAATHSEAVFLGPGFPPYQFDYSFEGLFNNGEILVPVVRNDVEMNDINWNFIGNPYASAIDVDLFFDENIYNAESNPNATLGGVIYLWSQNTAPSNNISGNEVQNFSNSDYAMINGSGENPGGDMITPNRYIPSGQGFFVEYSNDAPSNTGNVVFNNSMRVTGYNEQFFRYDNSSQRNKLSVKLTSDNGVFNQILVAYIEGATNANDGMYFDAPRNLASGNAAILYSVIEGESRKFAIQGRHPESLNIQESIPIGITNTIEEDTQFMLSIANLEGSFMTNNTIYLKDNMLNVIHDLGSSGYAFTSQVGDFNNRFEIVFSNTLSIHEFGLNQLELLAFENEHNEMEFSTSNQSPLQKLEVFDLLGRTLLDMDINEQQLVVKVHLNNIPDQSILIAKATTVNGQILTKKILK